MLGLAGESAPQAVANTAQSARHARGAGPIDIALASMVTSRVAAVQYVLNKIIAQSNYARLVYES